MKYYLLLLILLGIIVGIGTRELFTLECVAPTGQRYIAGNTLKIQYSSDSQPNNFATMIRPLVKYYDASYLYFPSGPASTTPQSESDILVNENSAVPSSKSFSTGFSLTALSNDEFLFFPWKHMNSAANWYCYKKATAELVWKVPLSHTKIYNTSIEPPDTFSLLHKSVNHVVLDGSSLKYYRTASDAVPLLQISGTNATAIIEYYQLYFLKRTLYAEKGVGFNWNDADSFTNSETFCLNTFKANLTVSLEKAGAKFYIHSGMNSALTTAMDSVLNGVYYKLYALYDFEWKNWYVFNTSDSYHIFFDPPAYYSVYCNDNPNAVNVYIPSGSESFLRTEHMQNDMYPYFDENRVYFPSTAHSASQQSGYIRVRFLAKEHRNTSFDLIQLGENVPVQTLSKDNTTIHFEYASAHMRICTYRTSDEGVTWVNVNPNSFTLTHGGSSITPFNFPAIFMPSTEDVITTLRMIVYSNNDCYLHGIHIPASGGSHIVWSFNLTHNRNYFTRFGSCTDKSVGFQSNSFDLSKNELFCNTLMNPGNGILYNTSLYSCNGKLDCTANDAPNYGVCGVGDFTTRVHCP